jgi:hypothetical protein
MTAPKLAPAQMAHKHLGGLYLQPVSRNTKEPGDASPRRVRLQAPPRRPDPLAVTDTPVQRVGLVVAILMIGLGLLVMTPNPVTWP